MKDNHQFTFYSGKGEQRPLPPFEYSSAIDDPKLYIANEGLRNAVNVALMLGQPLLVTGEPGTGKTQLAYSIAYELEELPVLRFNTKSTSVAKDLFYRYDALRHFQDSQVAKASDADKELSAEDYITFEAFGLAILLSLEKGQPSRKQVYTHIPELFRETYQTRSVVLIDEIDKAPRDLPNDILNEIEEMKFEVSETGREFAAQKANRPIVVLTSNSEKNLPDAFLRRCVFYHIEFPDKDALATIVENRLGEVKSETPPAIREMAIDHFEKIRKIKLKKPPATAELLGWIRVLEKLKLSINSNEPSKEDQDALIYTYSILAKNNEDLQKMIRNFHPGFPRG